jgi:hypothetical protein
LDHFDKMKTFWRSAVFAFIPILVARPDAAPSVPALFQSDEPIALQLKAPLEELIGNGRDDDTYSVVGTLSFGSDAGRHTPIENVKVSLRGHTSKNESECSFPKLKLRFGAPPPDGPFAGITSLKIGTHCGDSTGETLTAKFGRLPNEQSPYREAFIYRLLDVLQVPTLKVRPARITYVSSDGQQPPLVRNAMLLEDDDDARARLGADLELQPASFSNAQDEFKAEDTAQIAFAEALIGNFDWCLRVTADDKYRCDARRILWNVMALRGNGRTFALIYDFDVAGMAAGHHTWFGDVYNEAFVSSKSHAEVEVLGQLQRTRALFSREVLDSTRARFMQRKADAYRALKSAALDEAGRRRIQEYLDAFYAAIGSDSAFYRPVVTAPNTMPYTTAERTAVVCKERGAIPLGTAVSAPLATQGSMIQVILLDTQWNWATPVVCPAIHKGAVWIESASVSKDFPATTATSR